MRYYPKLFKLLKLSEVGMAPYDVIFQWREQSKKDNIIIYKKSFLQFWNFIKQALSSFIRLAREEMRY